jgi:polyketide synthase 12
MASVGMAALSDEHGLALFDGALNGALPGVVALALERSRLRARASAGTVPPLLSGLVAGRRRSGARASLAARLASVPEAERDGVVAELVRTEVAAVLGHGSAREVDPARAFKDLGFDSLAAVELRNRLQVATGLRLAATTVFDHPSADALASHLLGTVAPTGGGRDAIPSEERRVRELLGSIPLSRLQAAGLLDSLLHLVGERGDGAGPSSDRAEAIDAMDVEVLIRASETGGAGPDGPPVGVGGEE